MRTILWFIYFWAYVICLLPQYVRVRRMAKAGDIAAHDALTRKVARKWARRMVKAGGGTVSTKGLEHMPKGPAVYVGNHIGNFDIPLVMGYLGEDAKPIFAKKELRNLPLINRWMDELHCVFVDRKNPRSAVTSINEAAKWVGEGYSIVIFPEGTRSPTGLVRDFKGGAFKIAQKAHVPVVPFAIHGTDKIMGHNSIWIHPAHVSIEILPPIPTENFTRKDFAALPNQCANVIRAALGQPLI